MYKNIFLKAHSIPRDGAFLVITRDSCFKISAAAHSLLARLPAKGSEQDYLQGLSSLGVKDPGGIFKKLVEMKCLAWTDGRTRFKGLLKELVNPVIELIPGRLQERFFPFLRAGQFSSESLFRFSLYGALFGLALSVALPFWDGFLPSLPAGLGGHEGAAVMLLVALSVLVHELGHSSFAFLNGIGFRPIGFSVYLFFPVFYANISGVSELGLKPKLSVNLGGLALQGIFMGGLAALYLYSGLGLFYSALQYISYLVIFNMNPMINTDIYWCYKDTVAAYKGNRAAAIVDRVYSVFSLVFTAYLLHVAYKLGVAVLAFAARAVRGDWNWGGGFGALLSAYIVVILVRGIFARVKEALKPAGAAA